MAHVHAVASVADQHRRSQPQTNGTLHRHWVLTSGRGQTRQTLTNMRMLTTASMCAAVLGGGCCCVATMSLPQQAGPGTGGLALQPHRAHERSTAGAAPEAAFRSRASKLAAGLGPLCSIQNVKLMSASRAPTRRQQLQLHMHRVYASTSTAARNAGALTINNASNRLRRPTIPVGMGTTALRRRRTPAPQRPCMLLCGRARQAQRASPGIP